MKAGAADWAADWAVASCMSQGAAPRRTEARTAAQPRAASTPASARRGAGQSAHSAARRSKEQAPTTRQQCSAHTLLQMRRRHTSSRSCTRELLQRLASTRAPLALESQTCASRRRPRCAGAAPHPSRAHACAHAPDDGSGAARQPAVHTRARRQRAVTPGCVPPASKKTNDSSPDARLPGARAPSPRLSSVWRAHAGPRNRRMCRRIGLGRRARVRRTS